MFARIVLLYLIFTATTIAAPDIQHWQTDNGTSVYFVETHEIPMIDVQVVFDAGSSRDDDTSGLALLTNSLLAEGAAGLNADLISQNFEEQGAIYGSDVGYDSGSVNLRSVSDPTKLQPALNNLKWVITKPDFPLDAFERQRNRLLISIRQKQQSPGALADDAFYAAIYAEHPYASPKTGTEDSIKKLSREDSIAFHRQYYVAANAMIVIVGDLNRAQAEQLANDLIGDLPKGNQAPSLPEVSAIAKAETVRIDHPSTQMHILVGQPGMRRGDPDYFPLYVGNHVLGGGGMVSRLFEEIREKRGLSYSSYSYFFPMRKQGPFIAGLQTKSDQANQALEVLYENLKSFVKEGPSEEELQASKKNITGGFPLRIDSNSEIAGYLAMIGFYGLPLDYLDTFNKNVESVTVAQVKDAFKRRLSPDKFVTIMVGQKADSKGESH